MHAGDDRQAGWVRHTEEVDLRAVSRADAGEATRWLGRSCRSAEPGADSFSPPADVAVTGPSARLTTAGPRGEAIEVLDRVLQAVGWHDGPAELCPQFVGDAGPVAVMTDQAFAVCDRFDPPAVDMAGGGLPHGPDRPLDEPVGD